MTASFGAEIPPRVGLLTPFIRGWCAVVGVALQDCPRHPFIRVRTVAIVRRRAMRETDYVTAIVELGDLQRALDDGDGHRLLCVDARGDDLRRLMVHALDHVTEHQHDEARALAQLGYIGPAGEPMREDDVL